MKRTVSVLLAIIIIIGTFSFGTIAGSAATLSTPKVTLLTNTESGVQINWGKVSGSAQYRVFRKEGSNWKGLGNTKNTYWVNKAVTSGTSYTYTVRCVSADGKTFTSGYNASGWTVKYVAAPQISSLTVADGSIKISWKKVSGAAKYRVFMKSGNNWIGLGNISGTSYTHKNVTSGTSYTYTVRCISSDGKAYTSGYNKSGKSVVYLETPIIGRVYSFSGCVILNWQMVDGAEKYRVFRKSGNSSWVGIGNTTSFSLEDKNVSSGTEYTYTVRCVSNDGKKFTSDYDRIGKSIIYTPDDLSAFTTSFKQFFQKRGYNKAAICGMMANIYLECGMKPYVYSTTYGDQHCQAGGICMWSMDSYWRFIRDCPNWKKSLDSQYQYLAGTLDYKGSGGVDDKYWYYTQDDKHQYCGDLLKGVSNTKTGAQKAAVLFSELYMHLFERSGEFKLDKKYYYRVAELNVLADAFWNIV